MNLRTAQATLLVGALGMLLVATIGWFALVGPRVGELGEANERKSEAEDRTSSLSIQLAKLKAQAADLPQTRRQAAELALALPATADQPGFFAAVTDAADRAGIPADQITDISQGAPVLLGTDRDQDGGDGAADLPEPILGAELAVQQVTVSVVAPYRNLTRLLGHLETMDRVLFTAGIDVSANSDGESEGVSNDLNLTVTGITLIAPPLEAPEVDGANGRRGGGANDGGDTEQASG